jgi:chemotaxis protein MotB
MGRSRRISSPITAWPGYVDVLSALLMVVIFILMVFVIAQFLLTRMLNTQESELSRLNSQVAQLSELLGLEKEKTVQLSGKIEGLNDTIIALSEDRMVLKEKVAHLETQAVSDQAQIKTQLLTMASLSEDIDALRTLRAELEKKVGDLSGALSKSQAQAGDLRDRSKKLAAELAQEQERTLLAQEEIDDRDIRIQALSAVVSSQKTALAEARSLSADARAEMAFLSEQLSRLREQLGTIQNALAASRKQGEKKDEKIAELGKQLNIALARKVNRLEKYRSEFFGRLQAILKDNPAVKIQGDRFVFQAGLFFASGSATLEAAGRDHLFRLAETLLDVAGKIPQEINWILRIDGHTDRVPINNDRFASNWELSVARAVSVVRYLNSQGIPGNRMAAAGFSKYYPIDPANTPEALQKNRRIEIKLTSQ